MPRCLKCGNSTHFNCSYITKNISCNIGIDSGLVGFYNEENLINMENQGASFEDLNSAWINPQAYFNSCSFCGSENILWP